MVVPQADGELLLETPEGESSAALVAGQSYMRQHGVEHIVINNSAHEVVFIAIGLR